MILPGFIPAVSAFVLTGDMLWADNICDVFFNYPVSYDTNNLQILIQSRIESPEALSWLCAYLIILFPLLNPIIMLVCTKEYRSLIFDLWSLISDLWTSKPYKLSYIKYEYLRNWDTFQNFFYWNYSWRADNFIWFTRFIRIFRIILF